MNDFGLSKLFDSIGGALSIFDFSFFISGSITLSILLTDICAHFGVSWFDVPKAWPGWIGVVVLLMAIYICGLIAWMLGRDLRAGFLPSVDDGTDNSRAENDFIRVYDKYAENLEMATDTTIPHFKNKADIYSYMWIRLDSIKGNVNVKNRLNYCNRMWVMRAMFEGLLFAWLLAIVVLADLTLTCNLLNSVNFVYLIILFLFLVMLMYFSAKRATAYAHDQVKEIVIAYKIYVFEGREKA